jgi:FAD/FMN-containing dehydrogenase
VVDERDASFELSGDLLGVAGLDGYFKRLNPARSDTLGWTVAELGASPWIDFVHAEDLAPTLAAGEALGRGDGVVAFTNPYRCKDGAPRLRRDVVDAVERRALGDLEHDPRRDPREGGVGVEEVGVGEVGGVQVDEQADVARQRRRGRRRPRPRQAPALAQPAQALGRRLRLGGGALERPPLAPGGLVEPHGARPGLREQVTADRLDQVSGPPRLPCGPCAESRSRRSSTTGATPRSVAELREVVRGARRLRVMGSRHSWSRAIVTDDTLVSLARMNRIVDVDAAALRVTAQAGVTLRELIDRLERRGLALANLGSVAGQTVAGAIATGTHGTGLAFRCLAAQVEALRLVDGRGEERALRRGDPDFDAVVVGLGCFGVVHEVTLRVVPSFQMHALTERAPFDEVIANLDGYLRAYDHFKIWWLVPDDDVIVFKNRRTDAPRDDSDLARWFKDDLLSVVVYRALVALQRLDRRRLVPLVNRALGREVGRRHERVCKSHVGFLTPDPPVHRETEWAFDLADAPRLLREYRRALLASGHTYNFIQEVRFSRADDFWLSPAYGRDSVWIGMYNMDADAAWAEQLRLFEDFAVRHGGRPHWGKEASFDPAYLRGQFARLDEFRALAAGYDPEGKLASEWARRVLGVG